MTCPIKGILFDKDGTLFNYGEVWGEIISSSIEKILPISKLSEDMKKKCIREFLIVIGVDETGHTYSDGILFRHNRWLNATLRLLRIIFKYRLNPFKTGKVLISQISKNSYGLKERLDEFDFTDVRHVFEKCNEKGYIIGLVTSDSMLSTSIFLEKMDVNHMISFIRTDESSTKSKPNPQAIKEFCSEYNLKPSEVCMVGDTILDMVFAKRGKVGRKIAVLTGSGDTEALLRRSDAVYPTLKDILKDPVLFPPEE